MKRSLILLTALAAVAGWAVSTVGHANQTSGDRTMFERFDRNHDGQVVRAEVREALSDRFARIDANKDGTVTRDEQNAQRKVRQFHQMDADGDGGVTLAEMEAAMMRRVHRRFASLDTDKNGLITKREARTEPPKRAGRPRLMTMQDLDARVMRMFDRADRNKDGVITSDEANLMRPHGQRS